ncbi:hypothetical protein V8E53_001266 [Lactarius tabidus]
MPILVPVRNNRDRTRRARLPARMPSGRISSPRADYCSWYLAPSGVPFVAFGTAQDDTMLPVGGCAVFLQDITDKPLTCISACPLVPCVSHGETRPSASTGLGNNMRRFTLRYSIPYRVLVFELPLVDLLCHSTLPRSSTHMNNTMMVSTRDMMTMFMAPHIPDTRIPACIFLPNRYLGDAKYVARLQGGRMAPYVGEYCRTRTGPLIAEAVLKGVFVSGLLGRRQDVPE